MKQKLYTSDLIVLARDIMEMSPVARIQNIYHLSHHRFLLKFAHKEVSGSPFILFKPGEWIFQTDDPPSERPKIPTTFCQKLRKHVVNKRLKRCSCLPGNRILHFEIGHQDPDEPAHAHIYIEFFGQGNVILTDDQYRVLTFIYPHFYGELDSPDNKKGRIKVKEPYYYSAIPTSPLSDNLYGKDILNEMEYSKIDQVDSVLDKMLTSRKGYITPKECVPYRFQYFGYIEQEIQEFDSFSKALETYLKLRFPKKWALDNGISENQQRANMKSLPKKSIDYKKTFEYKKQNFLKCHQKKVSKIEHELNKIGRWIDLIEDHKDIVDSHLGNPNVQFYSDQHLCELVIKTHKIILFKDKSYYQNLSLLYSKKKEIQSKLEKTQLGLDKAILQLKRQFSYKGKTNKNHLKTGLADQLENTTQRWFEDYHWFYTSHGFLVICGRNHSQNEEIVKKHCQTNDLYIHSEVAGSGSAILKNDDKRKVSPLDLEEAGNFVICMSRAWQSRVADAAYWVYPDQVSKTTQTGEFVQSGSFIIRGTRNRIPNTELVLGIAIYQTNQNGKNETRIMCAPYRALSKLPKQNKIKIVPGKASRNKTCEKIVKSLGLTSRWKTAIDIKMPQGIQLG